MVNGAFVETPLQFLCAYEGLMEKGREDSIVYLRLSGRGNNDEQLVNVAKALDVDYEEVFFKAGFSVLNLRILFFMIRFCFVRYDYFFIRSYFSKFLRVIGFLVRAENVFYLDDGMATLMAQKEMERTGVVGNIFTFFDLPAIEGQTIERNNFSWLRKRFSYNRMEGLYFLGQPLVDYGYVTLESYCQCIMEAIKRSAPDRLFYIPHRHESDDVVSYIEGFLGVTVLRLTEPVELYLLKKKVAPRTIFSFSSTALITVNKIFPESKSVSFNTTYANYPHQGHLESIYAFFVGSGEVEVVSFGS